MTPDRASSSEAVGPPAQPHCNVCTQCGYNMAAERTVQIGPLRHDPVAGTSWADTPLRFTGQMAGIFGSLVHARGRILARDVLADRVGYEGDGNVIDCQLSRIRKILSAAGAPIDLIQSVWGKGVRLNLEFLTGGDALKQQSGSGSPPENSQGSSC